MRILVIIGCLLGTSLWGGCTPAPPIAEPFKRDRTGLLVRSITKAMDAQHAAVNHLDEANASLTDEALAGIEPSAAYDRGRRALIRSNSQFKLSRDAVKLAKTRGEFLFDQWRGEKRLYEDDGLRREAEIGLGKLRDQFEDTMRKLDAASSALSPAQVELADRTLSLKHAADQGLSPPAHLSPAGVERAEAARRALRDRTAEADAAVRSLVAAVASYEGTRYVQDAGAR